MVIKNLNCCQNLILYLCRLQAQLVIERVGTGDITNSGTYGDESNTQNQSQNVRSGSNIGKFQFCLTSLWYSNFLSFLSCAHLFDWPMIVPLTYIDLFDLVDHGSPVTARDASSKIAPEKVCFICKY